MFKVLKALPLVTCILIFFGIIGWAKNIYKLTQCDFEAPYKAEAIRTVGIIPIIGGVVGWMDFGK